MGSKSAEETQVSFPSVDLISLAKYLMGTWFTASWLDVAMKIIIFYLREPWVWWEQDKVSACHCQHCLCEGSIACCEQVPLTFPPSPSLIQQYHQCQWEFSGCQLLVIWTWHKLNKYSITLDSRQPISLKWVIAQPAPAEPNQAVDRWACLEHWPKSEISGRIIFCSEERIRKGGYSNWKTFHMPLLSLPSSSFISWPECSLKELCYGE